MAVYEIPVDVTYPSFVQEVELEGTSYRMEFRWNARESEWYLTLRDIDDVVLAGSRKLVTGAGLLRLTYSVDRPPGDLFVVNTVGDGQSSPGRYDLGSKLVLVYLDEEEVATTRTATVTELGGIIVHAEMRMKTPAVKALSAATWAKVSGTWETGLVSGFTFDAGGRLTYVGAEARTFLVTAALAAEVSLNTDLFLGLAWNGNAPGDEEHTRRDNAPSNDALNLAVCGVVTLTTGQFLEIYGKMTDAGNLTVDLAQVTVIG